MEPQVLLGWIGAATALVVAIGGVVGVVNSRRAGVAGDEREARRDEAVQRRDLLADRDALIDQLQAERDGLRAERDDWRATAKEADQALRLEQAWSRALVDQVYRLGGTPVPAPGR